MLILSMVLLVSAIVLYVRSPEMLLYSTQPWPVYGLLLGALVAARLSSAARMRRWPAMLAIVAVGAAVFWVHSIKSQADGADIALRPGDPFPEFTVRSSTGAEFSPSTLRGRSAALYVFYRGDWCPFCRTELTELVDYYGEFRENGVELFAVSVDPPEASEALRERLGLPFTFLSDPDGVVLDLVGIRHRGGHDGRDIAYPAQVLVDRDGIVRWTFRTASYRQRARPRDALAAIDDSTRAAASAD